MGIGIVAVLEMEIVALQSGHALPGIIPDLLIGAGANIEGELVTAGVELRRTSQRITAEALAWDTSPRPSRLNEAPL